MMGLFVSDVAQSGRAQWLGHTSATPDYKQRTERGLT
jgi:hypothetical protein